MPSTYSEINPVAIQIAILANEGLTDRQIGERLGFSRQTVYRYRHCHNIEPGRSHKLQKKLKTISRFKPLPLDKILYMG